MSKLLCTDCLEWAKDQPDNSVDLTFGSPPYEAQRTYGIGFNLKGQAWVDWMVERVVEFVRITKGLVAMVVEGRTEKFKWSSTPVLLMADLHRAGITLRKPPAFYRVGIPGSGGPDWLRNDYEFIVCATAGGKLPWSDNTAMGHTPKWAPGGEMSHRISDGSRVNQWGGISVGGNRGTAGDLKRAKPRPSHNLATKKDHTKQLANGDMEEQHYAPPVKANPGNVIKCKVGGGKMGSPLAHENEAPFPEPLAEFFVRSFCPPGGVVFDPFCGSGTTASVARRTGRDYVSTDVRQSQVDIAKRRLRTTQVELFT